MEILAIYLIVMAVLNIVAGPFFIGKRRDPYTARTWLIQCILGSVPTIVYIFWTLK